MSDLKKEHGTVTVEGVTINILQPPYLDGDVYQAVGMTDAQIEEAGGLGNVVLPCDAHYQLTWDIANPDAEDESEACDWDDVGATLC